MALHGGEPNFCRNHSALVQPKEKPKRVDGARFSEVEQERAARSAAMARVEGIQETLRTDLEEERRARIAVPQSRLTRSTHVCTVPNPFISPK